MRTVHFVFPDGIDDPQRPSGGNVYDRQLSRALGQFGWFVDEHPIAGCWPRPAAPSSAALAGVVERIPEGSVVLLDGLVASTAREVLVPQAHRLRLVVLVHMPIGHGSSDDAADGTRLREGAVLSAAAAVITTSAWSRALLLGLYQLPPIQVHIAEPGVEAADLAAGTASGGALLCVAPVISDKGHDTLLDALLSMPDLSWHCACVGSLDRDAAFAEALRQRALDRGLGDRVRFVGPRTGSDLKRSYAASDLLVLASRRETYGMVVTEALARGLPVVAADVGGVPEALGYGADGVRPGLLVSPDDPAALGAALRAWLSDHELRDRLRRAARQRRNSLRGWSGTAFVVAGVLAAATR